MRFNVQGGRSRFNFGPTNLPNCAGLERRDGSAADEELQDFMGDTSLVTFSWRRRDDAGWGFL